MGGGEKKSLVIVEKNGLHHEKNGKIYMVNTLEPYGNWERMCGMGIDRKKKSNQLIID